MENKFFCVISHTHWDREWYMPFEAFRLKLVDLIDRLLITIKKYPDYVFHLDAQTIVLEDYLEIRSENKNILKKHIKNGNIIVGPWYLQNDYYLTSGESTIRNLIAGHKISCEYGHTSKAGYAPDQFGNISQLPQILNNFGISSFIFGRGYRKHEKDKNSNWSEVRLPTEFIWRGADGTESLAIHMRYWYNNAQRFSEKEDSALLLCETMERLFKGISVVPYILMMNGVDHLEAQDNLLPILDKLNENFKNGNTIKQYVLDDYIKDVETYIKDNNIELSVHEGQLRSGHDWDILQGTLSSRPQLKRLNVITQNMLECRLEPIYAMLEAHGIKNGCAEGFFDFLWKQLMKNQPHDSICGCSRDEVHAHMEDSYSKILETSNVLYTRAMNLAANHMDVKSYGEDNYIILSANTTESVQKGIVKVNLYFPAGENVTNFNIYDDKGKKAEFRVIKKYEDVHNVFSPINLPGNLDVDVFEIYLYIENINPFSFKGYIIKTGEGKLKNIKNDKQPSDIKNEYLTVSADNKGTLTLINNVTGDRYDNFLYIEENYDRGDSYIYNNEGVKPLLSGDIAKIKVSYIENNEFIQTIKVVYDLKVPYEYDFSKLARSSKEVICTVDMNLTLKKNDSKLYIDYKLNNTAKDHRIRVVFNTGINTDTAAADIPFDIVTHTDKDHTHTTMSKVKPNTSFGALTDGDNGFAVFTKGQHEFEHITDDKALAFTIVRSTGVITRGNLKEIIGETWQCPANQCLREIEGEMAVMLFGGDIHVLPLISKAYRNPVSELFTSCDTKKFSGGRTAVQDTRLEELFYLTDIYEDKKIKDNTPAVSVDNDNIIVSAYKKSDDRKSKIIRLFNFTSGTQKCKITVRGNIYMSKMDESTGDFIGKNNAEFDIKAKGIITLIIK